MGDASHHVRAFLDGLLHELLAMREREDAFLREGDELQRHEWRDLLAHLQQCMQRGEARIGHIHMAAHVLNAVPRHHAQRVQGTVLDVLHGECLLALGPNADAVEERSGFVPFWVAGGKRCIEVHMRIHEWRNEHTTLTVYDFLALMGF